MSPNKLLTVFLLVQLANTVFAQKPNDTLIYNLPVVNDKLIYQGSGFVKDKSRSNLDTAAKKWFISYFTVNQLCGCQAVTIPLNNDTSGFVLNHGIIEYKVKPGMVNISFVAQLRIKVTCTNNHYNYKIDSILFRPKNNTLNAIGYQNDPEYLIRIYKRKHLGLSTAMDVTRGQIREYLAKMDAAVRDCIASLNKAMAN